MSAEQELCNMKKYLIIVDVQNDFINGVLGTNEAVIATHNICEYLDRHADEYHEIWATKDSHIDSSYLKLVEGRYIPIHCVEGTDGERIYSAISERIDSSHVEYKNSFAAMNLFLKLDLFRYLENDKQKRERFEFDFVGLCTDICVISNALAARSIFPESTVRVIKDCCAGTTPEKHNAALEVMESCLIDVV